jgi:hypothetical protein
VTLSAWASMAISASSEAKNKNAGHPALFLFLVGANGIEPLTSTV